MVKIVDWSKYFKYSKEDVEEGQKKFGMRKIYAMGLMPVRGPKGFRKLDYEFAEKGLNVKEVVEKLQECHFNVLGLVIKDTDGACMWDTKAGWNPTGRDILGEFSDEIKDTNLHLDVSFTSMNDAYQGHIHPERVSVHGKDAGLFKRKKGEFFRKGEISTHDEGEMRIDLPEGVTIEEYQKKVPFLTNKIDQELGKSRGARGKGYIPTTSFMCPNSKHIDYLLSLAEEVVKNYPVRSFMADYIRYDGGYTDLCLCKRCQTLFRNKYGSKPKFLKSKQWYEFKANSIARYALRLHKKIKSIKPDCITGWFMLPGPKFVFTRNRIAQDWTKLSTILDIISPMEYPYLIGTYDDGFRWGKLADLAYWYFIGNMKRRAHEIRSPALTVTNSVECNAEEMLKSMRGFDFGLGIAVFKYYGTKESQWKALKKYAEEEIGLEALGLK